MKILSFDQGTEKTGYALYDGTTMQAYGLIDLHKEKNLEVRPVAMQLQIFDLIEKYAPDGVVLEDVNLQRNNPGTLIKIAKLLGGVLGYCYDHEIPVVALAASAWRKALQFKQGKGTERRDLKQQAKDLVKKIYGADVSEDEADAICIGLAAALAQEQEEEKQTAQEATQETTQKETEE